MSNGKDSRKHSVVLMKSKGTYASVGIVASNLTDQT